jgi:protein-S-isoprenylcysteine O-methyltransferase Ste14
VLGAALVGLGAIPLGESILRFVRQGHGTPAPWAPTDRLIVSGFYPYVRNPMYIGVLLMILGQAVLLWSAAIAIYGTIAALGFHLWVLGYEEPFLRRRYGDAYQAYCRRVHRWWPRIPRSP